MAVNRGLLFGGMVALIGVALYKAQGSIAAVDPLQAHLDRVLGLPTGQPASGAAGIPVQPSLQMIVQDVGKAVGVAKAGAGAVEQIGDVFGVDLSPKSVAQTIEGALEKGASLIGTVGEIGGVLGLEGAAAAIAGSGGLLGYGGVPIVAADIAGMTGSELGAAIASGAIQTGGAGAGASAAPGLLATAAPYALLAVPAVMFAVMSYLESLSEKKEAAFDADAMTGMLALIQQPEALQNWFTEFARIVAVSNALANEPWEEVRSLGESDQVLGWRPLVPRSVATVYAPSPSGLWGSKPSGLMGEMWGRRWRALRQIEASGAVEVYWRGWYDAALAAVTAELRAAFPDANFGAPVMDPYVLAQASGSPALSLAQQGLAPLVYDTGR